MSHVGGVGMSHVRGCGSGPRKGAWAYPGLLRQGLCMCLIKGMHQPAVSCDGLRKALLRSLLSPDHGGGGEAPSSFSLGSWSRVTPVPIPRSLLPGCCPRFRCHVVLLEIGLPFQVSLGFSVSCRRWARGCNSILFPGGCGDSDQYKVQGRRGASSCSRPRGEPGAS